MQTDRRSDDTQTAAVTRGDEGGWRCCDGCGDTLMHKKTNKRQPETHKTSKTSLIMAQTSLTFREKTRNNYVYTPFLLLAFDPYPEAPTNRGPAREEKSIGSLGLQTYSSCCATNNNIPRRKNQAKTADRVLVGHVVIIIDIINVSWKQTCTNVRRRTQGTSFEIILLRPLSNHQTENYSALQRVLCFAQFR